MINGTPAWSSWNEIFEQIDVLCGAGASRCFAAPTNINRQADGETLNVAWFCSYNDEPRTVDSLDSTTRTRIFGDLTAALTRLQPAMADERIGATVSAMLNLYDDTSIFAVGERAILTNWGALPSSVSSTQAAFARHSAATIGPFLSAGVTPRVPGQSWMISGNGEAAGISPPPLAKEAVQTAPKAAGAGGGIMPAVRHSVLTSTAGLLALGGLAAISLVFLAYISWPGHLVYEKEAAAAPIAPAERAELDAGLRERIEKLKAELNKNACEVDRTLLGISLAPGAQQSNLPFPQAENHGNPDDPAQTPDSRASDANLTPLDKVDAATVLVITQSGIGSGFFINDKDILTNRHVIEKGGDTVFAANSAFQKPIRARVIAKSGDSRIGNADFALLRVEEPASGIRPLEFSTSYKRNDNVLAGGFPYAVLKEDDTFQKVISGDTSAMSSLQLVPTPGTIWLLPHGGQVQRIMHSAEISPGNSGGPLVDACGRVVGINTFIETHGDILQKLNVAISAKDAIAFLNDNQVHPRTIDEACRPRRAGEEPMTAGENRQ